MTPPAIGWPAVSRFLAFVLLAGISVFGAACSGDDDAASGTPTTVEGDEDGGSPEPRFCDVYLDYLGDSTDENLQAVADAADDPEVRAYVDIIEGADEDVTAVVAATLDLDDLARSQCQPEWTAGAQGAGDSAGAAQALLDALLAGDPIGARNVASLNAIAVFEPWDPLPENPEAGTPTVVDVDDRSFSLALDPATLAECQVETGVIVACQIAE